MLARLSLGENEDIVEAVKTDYSSAPVSDKLTALLAIAKQVQSDARKVSPADVDKAKAAGASDLEIHDTVLIAAAFSMFNRYVDGLATWTPDDPSAFEKQARIIVDQGYVRE